MDDPATDTYQRSLALAFLAVSPSLAALHTHRLSHPADPADDPLTPSTCTKCGTLLLPGNGSIRLTRTRRRSSHPSSTLNEANSAPRRRLTKTCNVCGFVDVVQLGRSAEDGNMGAEGSTTIGSFEPARTLYKRRLAAAAGSHSSHLMDLPGPLPAGDNAPSSTHVTPAQTPTPGLGPVPASFNGASSPQIALLLQSAPVSRKKKKKPSTLQDMLARNRQMQEQKKEQRAGGLLGFLDGF